MTQPSTELNAHAGVTATAPLDTPAGGRVAVYTVVVAALLCVLPLLGYMVPRALSFFPGVIGLAGFLGAWFVYRQRPPLHRASLMIVAAIVALALASALWAIRPDEAAERALKTALVLFPGVLLLSVLKQHGASFMPLFVRYFPLVTILAFALALLDLQSYGALFSFFRGREIDDGFNESNLNRGVIVLTLCLFPAYLAVIRSADIWRGKARTAVLALLAALTLGVFLRTDSQSAHLIFAVCVFGLVVFPVTKSRAWTGLWLVLGVLTLGAPWLAQYMFQTLPEWIGGKGWFEQSYALNRLEIWDFVARYIEKNPLCGFGIEAARYIEDFDSALRYHDESVILHPHNFALQLWLEFGALGALGAVILFGLILRSLRDLARINPENARLGLVVFLSALCPAATAYGLWQGWQLGAFFMLAGFCLVLFPQKRSGDGA